MRLVTKLKKSDVAKLVAATFPSYTGRKFWAEAATEVEFYDLNWGGGTRNQCVVVELATGRVADMRRLSRNHPANQPTEGLRVELPAGVVVVRHSIFCGRDTGLTFFYNPADRLEGATLPALLGGAR